MSRIVLLGDSITQGLFHSKCYNCKHVIKLNKELVR